MPRQLIASAPRVAEIVEYENREISSKEVKVRVEYAAN